LHNESTCLLREWSFAAPSSSPRPFFFGLIEGGLRLADAGYPPEFFLRTEPATPQREIRLEPVPPLDRPHAESRVLPSPKQNVAFWFWRIAAMGFPDLPSASHRFCNRSRGDWRVTTRHDRHQFPLGSRIASEAPRSNRMPSSFIWATMKSSDPMAQARCSPFLRKHCLIRAHSGPNRCARASFSHVRRQALASGADSSFFVHNQYPTATRACRVYHTFAKPSPDRPHGRRARRARHPLTVAVEPGGLPAFRLPMSGANGPSTLAPTNRARDLDALRLRADSRINAIIREVALAEKATLIDAARAIERRAPIFGSTSLAPNANRRLAEWIGRRAYPRTRSANLPVPPGRASAHSHDSGDHGAAPLYRRASSKGHATTRPAAQPKLGRPGTACPRQRDDLSLGSVSPNWK